MKLALVSLLVLAVAAPARGETVVAVMEFSNTSPTHDMDALGKGLQSMITTDLSEVKTLQLVERERLNDIQSELKLQRSSLIDKAAATKIGKLAGVTHVCSGTFTVIGAKMRIDARLYLAQNGEILLAEKIEGERDAFFDLEKSLVKKVISAVGIKLAPKERVAVEHVQTTDFQAFQKYSEGMQAFDDKRYDDALSALREAAKRDSEFKLASSALEEYGKAVGHLRHKLSAIDIKELAENEVELAEYQKEIKQGNPVYWYEIYQVYYREPKGRGDRFARERAIDDVARQYFYSSMKGWRDWYAHSIAHGRPDCFNGFLQRSPPVIDSLFLERSEANTHHKWFNSNVAGAPLVRDLRHKDFYFNWENSLEYLIEFVLLDHDYFSGVKLHYDDRQIIALQEELTHMAIRATDCPILADDKRVRLLGELRRHLATILRTNLEFKRSTQALEEAARSTEDREEILKITAEVEYNRDLEAVLASAPNKSQMRQLLQGRWLTDIKRRDHVLSAALGLKDPKIIQRSFYLNDYIVINKTPVWLVRGDLSTGARSDDRHADEIIYYAGGGSLGAWAKKQPAEAVAVLGGQQLIAALTSFVVDYAPGGDWFSDEPVGSERPEVGLAFGMSNVDSAADSPHGWTVLVGGKTIRFAEFTGERDLKLQIKEQRAVDFMGTQRLAVTFELSADSVTAIVNGERFSFRVPHEHTGFYGIHVRGQGFASVKTLEVR